MGISFLCRRRARRFIERSGVAEEEDLAVCVKRRMEDKFAEEVTYMSITFVMFSNDFHIVFKLYYTCIPKRIN